MVLGLPPVMQVKLFSSYWGHEDAMAAPASFPGVGSALGHHVPDVLILRSCGESQSDIDAAKERDRLPDWLPKSGVGSAVW
jgi:hypothetical protein